MFSTMSLIDKISRPAGGLDPLLDSSLPAWKKDLILKKRAMHRTFPFHLSVAECGRSKHLASGVGDERSSVPAASLHAWRNSAEGSGALRKPQALGRELNNTGDGGDATHAFQNCRDMTEEQVNANNNIIDGGISRLELSGRSESTSPSLHGGSQQSLVYDPESASDNEEEYEYGPGIVNRLRSKFISLTRRDGNRGPTTPPPPPQPSFLPVRRVASMEHLLDEPFSSSSRPMRSARRATPSSSSRSLAIPHSTTEVLKRARSMETLSAVDRGPVSSHSFVPRFMYRGFSREDGPPLSPVNDNVIIIEQPKPSQSNPNHISGVRLAQDGRNKGTLLTLLDEDEFPKPDTVRTCKKIFEHSTGDSESNGVPPAPPAKRKVAPPPKPPGLKPGPKPVFARRISSPGGTKPVFKLLEQNEKRGDETPPTPPIEATVEEGLGHPSSVVASSLTNGVADTVTEIPEYVPDPFEPNENKLPDQVGTLDSCAKRNDFHEDAIANPAREPSPVPDLVTVTAEDEEPLVEANSKPKVVSFQPKPDDKDRPIGHIRPFQPAEQNSAAGAIVQDETYSIPNGGDASPTYAFPPKKPIPPPSQGLVSQVFNFIGKQVQAHIPNNAAPFEARRRPTRQADRVNSANVENLTPHSNGSGSGYYIVGDGGTTDDYSDEEDGIDSSMDMVSGPGVTFVGDNIIVGRSALMKTRNKKLKIAFDDQALSTYEYPSENSLLDNESQGVGSLGTDRDESANALSNKSQDTLKSTPGIGSSSGLGSYKPMAVGSAQVFKLGEMPAPNAPVSNRASQNTAKEEVDEEDLFLKPAPDDQNQVWSSAETSDILF